MMTKDIKEYTLKQAMYANYKGETEAHIRAAKGYSKRHRHGSSGAHTRRAWKTAWEARRKLKGFTKPQGTYERIARTRMMGKSSSKPWHKLMKRADSARLDPSIPYGIKRAGRDPRFSLTIGEQEGNNMTEKVEEGLKDYAKSVAAGMAMDAAAGTKGTFTAVGATVPIVATIVDKLKDMKIKRTHTRWARQQELKNKVVEAKEDTPSTREFGTQSLTDKYTSDTPGQKKPAKDVILHAKESISEALRSTSAFGTGRVRHFGRISSGVMKRATSTAARNLSAKTTRHAATLARRRQIQQKRSQDAGIKTREAAKRFPR